MKQQKQGLARVRWAVENLVPLNGLTIVAGTPGVGKSQLIDWIVARASLRCSVALNVTTMPWWRVQRLSHLGAKLDAVSLSQGYPVKGDLTVFDLGDPYVDHLESVNDYPAMLFPVHLRKGAMSNAPIEECFEGLHVVHRAASVLRVEPGYGLMEILVRQMKNRYAEPVRPFTVRIP